MCRSATTSSTTSHACPAHACLALPRRCAQLGHLSSGPATIRRIITKIKTTTSRQTASPLNPRRPSVPSSRGSSRSETPAETPADTPERLCAVEATPPLDPRPFGDLRTNRASATRFQHHPLHLPALPPIHQRLSHKQRQRQRSRTHFRPCPCQVARFTFTIPALYSRVMLATTLDSDLATRHSQRRYTLIHLENVTLLLSVRRPCGKHLPRYAFLRLRRVRLERQEPTKRLAAPTDHGLLELSKTASLHYCDPPRSRPACPMPRCPPLGTSECLSSRHFVSSSATRLRSDGPCRMKNCHNDEIRDICPMSVLLVTRQRLR